MNPTAPATTAFEQAVEATTTNLLVAETLVPMLEQVNTLEALGGAAFVLLVGLIVWAFFTN
jgi:hypothetical protein